MAHTPGPWYALPGLHNISIRHKTGDKYFPMINVASVRGRFGTDCPYGQSESNARLIAAAPDLLEALQLAHKALEAIANEMTVGERYTNAGQYLLDSLEPSRAAIAKATGEQQ